MCGRFTQRLSSAELARAFDARALVDDPGGHFNLAPTQDAAVVVEREGDRALTAYRWGLIPHWAKDSSIGSRLINARAETLTTGSAFRDAFRRHRCLVPVDGFYEWRRTEGPRQPFYIRRSDGEPFALAGLWSAWHDPKTDELVRTFTIVTTAPNELVGRLHDRMPVIIDRADWSTWLAPDVLGSDELLGLLRPFPDGPLEAYPVSRLVNSARNDGPLLVEPVPEEVGEAPAPVRSRRSRMRAPASGEQLRLAGEDGVSDDGERRS